MCIGSEMHMCTLGMGRAFRVISQCHTAEAYSVGKREEILKRPLPFGPAIPPFEMYPKETAGDGSERSL